jgi:hypothetical protein
MDEDFVRKALALMGEEHALSVKVITDAHTVGADRSALTLCFRLL